VPKTLVIGAMLVLSIACAGRNRPAEGIIVDMKGVDPVQYRKDLDECTAYASQVDTSGKVGGNAAGGAVVGGAIGAIFGGAEGAARGAGAGAVGGGARGVDQTVHERHQVIRNCLEHRGYSVLN
jgi:outer membrane lipoprotein SlyB